MPKTSISDLQKVPIFLGSVSPDPLIYMSYTPKSNSTPIKCKKAYQIKCFFEKKNNKSSIWEMFLALLIKLSKFLLQFSFLKTDSLCNVILYRQCLFTAYGHSKLLFDLCSAIHFSFSLSSFYFFLLLLFFLGGGHLN